MSILRNQMIQHMELKNYSPKTIKAYLSSLMKLTTLYNTSPELITVEQIKSYLHEGITVKKLSRSWVNQTLSSLKILLCDVLKREWEFFDIGRPRREKKLPVVLSRAEVRAILQVPKNLKHRALITLAYSAGLRLSEVTHLKPGDIDSARMQVRVIQAKGNKDRWTVLSPVALELLREYWLAKKPKVWLFETRPGKMMCDKAVQTAFKNALRKSGVKKDVGIHSLRHSFATHLMEQGVALPVIQQMLGHTSLRTTSIYLHVQEYSVATIKSPLDTL